MATPDKEALDAINRLDSDYRTLRDSVYPRLVRLVQIGVARCEDVRRYNLAMMAVYNAQAAILLRLRAAGIEGVPEAPPFPPLFARLDTSGRVVAGQDALFLACPADQPFLGPKAVRPTLTPAAITVEMPNGQFENLPATFEGFFLPILIAGVIIYLSTTVVIAVWQDADRDKAISKNTLEAVHAEVELRKFSIDAYDAQLAKCGAFDPTVPPDRVKACAEAAKKTLDAAKDLDSLKALAGLKPKGGLGLLEKVGIAAIGVAVILGGLYIYRRRKASRRASAAAMPSEYVPEPMPAEPAPEPA